jgi:hypothetical protein
MKDCRRYDVKKTIKALGFASALRVKQQQNG